MSSPLVKPAPFAADSSPKRRKTAHPKEFNPDEDSGDDLFSAAFSDEVATLPLTPSHFKPPAPTSLQQPFTSSPPPPHVTQATQIMAQAKPPPVIQVEASSPFRMNHSSPSRPSRPSPPPPPAHLKSKASLKLDGSVKPFDFYPLKTNGKSIDLTGDGPQYIGASSDDDNSDHGTADIKPTFIKAPSANKAISSASSLRNRRDNNSSAEVITIKESPISMKDLAARFRYNAKNPSSTKPSAGRLDSVTRKPSVVSSAGGMAGPYMNSRPRLQRHPDRAQPLADIRIDEIDNLEYRKMVVTMKSVLPAKTYRVLLDALVRKKGNYDDAMDQLTISDDSIDLTFSADEKKGVARTKTSRAAAAAAATSNRAVRAPRVAIKDKWSSTQAEALVISSSPPSAPKTRRRLVRGSNRTSRERSSSPPAPITIDDDDSDSAAGSDDNSERDREVEKKVLEYVNKCTIKELADIAATTEKIAQVVISQRPFKSIDQIREVSRDVGIKGGKRGARTRAIGDKIIDVCLETWRGYEAVDSLIQRVAELGAPIAESIKKWGIDIFSGNDGVPGELDMTEINIGGSPKSVKDSAIGTPTDTTGGSDILMMDDGDDVLKATRREPVNDGFFKTQPSNMAEDVTLKDYQLVGVNWLSLLYSKNLSCILADEMGLGKTCQVIAFLAHLLEKEIKGPHLVVVPSSTLENWLREFQRFCPALKVEPYYGSQKERIGIRMALTRDKSWNVLVTTYQLATGDKMDKRFLKEQAFNVCVYDEGHLLKNSASNRYDALMRLPAKFRLLLTGTPLQNNLQELASLLAFILPGIFSEKREDLASIFKYKAKTTDDEESNSALLSAQRIKRARAMMTPFVLRRKKQQVLKHLPGKTSRVEFCDMNAIQQELYAYQITTARESIEARAAGKKATKNTTNLMMQLRKAAIHPLLFRNYYDNGKIKKMSHEIMKEEAYRTNDQAYILEDMEVMNDFELNRLCRNFPSTLGKYQFQAEEWMNSGKVQALKKMLVDYKQNGDRVLVFSQFTQMLDILEMALSTLDMDFLRIDGSTPVDARQDLIDQYHEEEDITVFLLSTKAGGFGINLACANKVIIFDSSFNPHDDAQASDRAHRVGQKREVEVVRLVTKNTIEEQILALANTKLALDQSISSEGDEKALEGKAEEIVAKMLLSQVTTTAAAQTVVAQAGVGRKEAKGKALKKSEEPKPELETKVTQEAKKKKKGGESKIPEIKTNKTNNAEPPSSPPPRKRKNVDEMEVDMVESPKKRKV